MNLILLFDEDFLSGHRARLTGRRFTHIRDIHKAGVGDVLTIGICGGRIGTGRIDLFEEDTLEMEVAWQSDPPEPLPLTLVLALPRPLMLNRILQAVSSMGVKRLILFHSQRVEKSFWKSPVLSTENLKAQSILGLEQARDTFLPEITLKPNFYRFVENDLPGLARGARAFVAHPGEADPCPRHVQGPVTLLIGPEGGFVPEEIEIFKGLGIKPIGLGPRILRVETAVAVLLAKMF